MEESAGGPTISVLRLDGESGYGNSEPLEVQEDPTHGRYPGKMGPERTFHQQFYFSGFFFLWCGWVERGSLGYVGKISDLFSKKIGNHLEIPNSRPKWWDFKGTKIQFGEVFFTFFLVPSRELRYPTLGNGKSSTQKCNFLGDMLVSCRVDVLHLKSGI